MPTTITNLSTAELDDAIIQALHTVLPVFSAFSTRLNFERGLVLGSKIKVPVVGDLTVGNKTAGTLVSTSGSITGVDVTLDAFKGASWELAEGSIDAATAGEYWKGQIPVAVSKLAKTIVDAALANLTAANFATEVVVGATSTWTPATLAAIQTAADNKLLGGACNLLLGAEGANKLISLEQIVYAFAIANGANTLASGQLPTALSGMPAYKYVGMPTAGNMLGAVISPAAIGIAAGAPSQIIRSGEGNVVERRIVEDPESGFSVQYTEAVDAGGKITGEVAAIYGSAKATDRVVRVVSAANT